MKGISVGGDARKRVLFMCETVTLAHIMRTFELARSLDPSKYEVHIAAGEIPRFLDPQRHGIQVYPLESVVPAKAFLAFNERGWGFPYDNVRVEAQIEEDLLYIRLIRPDVVIGDFRYSLGVSARLEGIPYVNITNVTLNPTVGLPVQVPYVKAVRVFGERIALTIFRWLRLFLFRRFAGGFNKAARKRGLKEARSLLDLYTSGDYVFYADVPGLVETRHLPSHHLIAGPIISAVPGPRLPPLPVGRNQLPIVVVSLGSSGHQDLVPAIVEALSGLPVRVFVATAGRKIETQPHENVVIADYLPLDAVFSGASLAICNGGSATGYVALAKGVPLLAIPSNYDQVHFAAAVVLRGAGRRIRPEKVSVESIRELVSEMLSVTCYRQEAERLRHEIGSVSAIANFSRLIAAITSGEKPTF